MNLGYLKKLRFIRDERQPVKQQSLLINILYTSIKSSKVPPPVQYSCADALLDALQIKSPQDRDITRCLTSWYKNLEKNKGTVDPLVQLYNSKLQAFENQRIEL
ncbi:hypothetical protein LOD99_14708 [Oopsacas minuta]|uniref:Uncharacterized protein n=1 Tax=Oopsacas minuta TaxID=111878 RepID=A0AAV7KC33_9METZ|nr:hypothetical protein LOD99_14708 [Oopsacas minuta]